MAASRTSRAAAATLPAARDCIHALHMAVEHRLFRIETVRIRARPPIRPIRRFD